MFSQTPRPSLPALAALVAFSAFSPGAKALVMPPPATIQWMPCPKDIVSEQFTSAFQGRLECGTMPSPLTYVENPFTTVDIGLIRLKAELPQQREGAIFFNFGGPGGHPANFLPVVAAAWTLADPDSPLEAYKRQLVERYDLIAVVPRGLRGSPRLRCAERNPNEIDPSIYFANWNWDHIVKNAIGEAKTCGGQFGMQYADTMSHVADMEYARLSLGEPALNFIGVSYGTWVGAYYAATFPEHMGRFVLDSSMDITSTFEKIQVGLAADIQALFERNIVSQVLHRPVFNVTERDTAAVMATLSSLPAKVKNVWMTQITNSADLAAVLAMAPWINAEGWPFNDAPAEKAIFAKLRARVRTHRFSQSVTADNQIRTSAEELIELLEPETALEPVVEIGTYLAVVCGDTPWERSPNDWRNVAIEIGAKYPVAGGGSVVTGLACRYWPVKRNNKPSLERLADAPPVLMIQAEHDTSTPLSGANRTLDAIPSARMVVANNMIGHGVLGLTGTPCVERAVGRYLLTGELPAARTTSCAYQPLPPSRHSRSAEALPAAADLREQLRKLFRHS